MTRRHITRALHAIAGIGLSEADLYRARMERLAQYHARAAADFYAAGDDASAAANLRLAEDAMAEAGVRPVAEMVEA